MASTWKVSRDLRWEYRDELVARDTTPKHFLRSNHLDPWLEAIFRRIWPEGMKRKLTKKLLAKRDKEKANSPVQWFSERKSFPLATAEV
jgi:hypothetical protein